MIRIRLLTAKKNPKKRTLNPSKGLLARKCINPCQDGYSPESKNPIAAAAVVSDEKKKEKGNADGQRKKVVFFRRKRIIVMIV